MMIWLKLRLAAVIAGSLVAAGAVGMIVLVETHAPAPGTASGQVAMQAEANPALAPVQPVAATTTEPASKLFGQYANSDFHDGKPLGSYFEGLDPDTKRMLDSVPVGYIHSTNVDAAQGQRYLTIPAAGLRGKRIRVLAWLKTTDAVSGGGLWMVIWHQDVGLLGSLLGTSLGSSSNPLVYDDMLDRAVHGTTDWKRYQMVVDVPDEADNITLGYQLYGSGELWTDDFKVEVVSPDVPTTDDSHWRLVGRVYQKGLSHCVVSSDYRVSEDAFNLRQGHPTTCISSSTAPRSAWASYDYSDHFPDDYRGHRIRVTAWAKCKNVSVPSGISIFQFGDEFKLINPGGQQPSWRISGTKDWTKLTAIVDVPADVAYIEMGYQLCGRGKMWVDDFHCEVADDAKLPGAGGL